MKLSAKTGLTLCAALAFGACGGDDPVPVPSPDVSTDSASDVGVDASPDSDSDVDPDVDPDVGPDTDINADAVDPCDGLELCAEEGSACDGDTVVLCEENDDGCLVETTTGCGETAVCDDTGTDALCVEEVCAGLELCDEAGVSCDELDLIDCTENEDGCIVRTATACEVGTECSEGGEVAECIATCVDAEGCAAAGDGTCDGTVLEICELGESGCLEIVETDCAVLVDGGACDAVALLCLTPGDPCEGVDPIDLCDAGDVGAAFCDGDIYALCTTNLFGCAFLEPTDCALVDGGFCTAGGCDVIEAGACDEVDPADECDEEGALSCGEAGVIECQRDEDGCLVLTDAGACGDGEICEAGLCVGLCEDVVVCESEASCDGDDFVTCSSVEGCLVESGRETCATGCDDSGGVPACVPIDPCVDLACDLVRALPYCDGTLLFTCVSDDELECDHFEASDCSVVEPGTICVDDGFAVACEADPCGDGLFDGFVGEECDDGNNDDGDGCSAICALEDGFICTPFEGGSVCTEVVCGDGAIGADEECDDENTDDDDGCSATCTVEDGYECTGEPSECLIPVCGDGIRNGTESCDDGNLIDEDGCSSECWIEVSGLAGATAAIEAAIDGSEAQYARQGASCRGDDVADHYFDAFTIVNIMDGAIEISILASWGGDGYLHVFSDGFDPADPRATCIIGDDDFGGPRGSFIASVVLEADSNYVIVASTFSPAAIIGEYSLTLATTSCGDGVVGAVEECDDGNIDDGDGCAADCTIEDTFECDDEPSFCYVPDVCGGGVVDEAEECDDGNTDDGDGCAADCTVEAGFICTGETSLCLIAVCGDGLPAPGESCDDGNVTDGDGCSAACAVELEADATFDLTGSIDDTDPTFNRASESCLGLSNEVYYDVFPIVNATAGPLDVTVTADWSGDGYLHAYTGFDPSDALLECIAGDDDFGELLGSQIIFRMESGTSAEIVPSTFGTLAATGAYTLEVDPVTPET